MSESKSWTAIIADHAEDIALALGSLMTAFGVALRFGAGWALIALGVLSLCYGVWIATTRRP